MPDQRLRNAQDRASCRTSSFARAPRARAPCPSARRRRGFPAPGPPRRLRLPASPSWARARPSLRRLGCALRPGSLSRAIGGDRLRVDAVGWLAFFILHRSPSHLPGLRGSKTLQVVAFLPRGAGAHPRIGMFYCTEHDSWASHRLSRVGDAGYVLCGAALTNALATRASRGSLELIRSQRLP